MQVTAIGTVWRCVPNQYHDEDDEESQPYVVELVEYLPGNYDENNGAQGQAINLYLDSAELLREGMTYRVTTRVTRIWPTQIDDNMNIIGVLIEAKLIE
jgi:hypothetical protein